MNIFEMKIDALYIFIGSLVSAIFTALKLSGVTAFESLTDVQKRALVNGTLIVAVIGINIYKFAAGGSAFDTQTFVNSFFQILVEVLTAVTSAGGTFTLTKPTNKVENKG